VGFLAGETTQGDNKVSLRLLGIKLHVTILRLSRKQTKDTSSNFLYDSRIAVTKNQYRAEHKIA